MNQVDQYISGFPKDVQHILKNVRQLIIDHAPGVEEGFSYGMPAYKSNKRPLIYFAAFKHHLGIYALPSGHAAFAEALSAYTRGKGSVQFPFDQPIPYDLITKMVQFRFLENQQKASQK